MRLYLFLDRMGWPRSYLGKILFLSFLGVHIPLIGAVLYLLLSSGADIGSSIGVLVALLVATLMGTGLTWLALYSVLAPVRVAAQAMDSYLRDKQVPRLPTRLRDDAGLLLANVQEGVTRLDAALDAAHRRAEDTEKDAKHRFGLLSSMSHELRTPLNHIIGFAEMMSSEALGPLGQKAYHGYAEHIGSSGGQLLEVLQSVLDLSQVAAGEVHYAPEPLRLNETIASAVGLAHLRAQSAGVDIALPEDRAGNLTVLADPRALKQLLLQALSIAIDSAGTGVAVRINGAGADGMASVEVAHDGPGWHADDVPPEMRGEIPGLRGQNDTPAGIKSSSPQALCLSLLRALAVSCGGAVRIGYADPATSHGRRIELHLPLASAAALQRAA